MESNRLMVFLRAPQRGRVKTRLAAGLGEVAALTAYRTLLAATLGAVAELPGVELRVTPDNATEELEPWLRTGWTARPQGPGDLGKRLGRACAEAFAQHAERLAIIGSDCPYLTASDVRAAWSALDRFDVVLGPARDGGYWLLALKAPQSALFRDIAWGGPTVLAETLARATEAVLSVHQLRELSDVDTAADWAAYLETGQGASQPG